MSLRQVKQVDLIQPKRRQHIHLTKFEDLSNDDGNRNFCFRTMSLRCIVLSSPCRIHAQLMLHIWTQSTSTSYIIPIRASLSFSLSSWIQLHNSTEACVWYEAAAMLMTFAKAIAQSIYVFKEEDTFISESDIQLFWGACDRLLFKAES